MQQQQENTGLVWFRNNLRIQDNVSLKKAIDNHNKVIAVYFFDPKYFSVDKFGFKKTAKIDPQMHKTRFPLKVDFCNTFHAKTSFGKP